MWEADHNFAQGKSVRLPVPDFLPVNRRMNRCCGRFKVHRCQPRAEGTNVRCVALFPRNYGFSATINLAREQQN